MSDYDEPKNVDSALDFLLAPPTGTFYNRFRQRHLSQKLLTLAGVAFVGLLLILYALWWRAPSGFPAGIFITVKNGMTLSETSVLLASKDVIRSPFWFKAWSLVFGGTRGLKAGEYYLLAPVSVFPLAWRFTKGLEDLVPVRITVREGLSNSETATLLSKSLPHFDRRRFLELAAKKEGYLFPDTYAFLPNSTEEQIIEQMEQNFSKRTLPLQKMIRDFGKPLHVVLTMASLIEGEVRTTETRKQVSGILWKRLELSMPLQVDAVFPYILGKNTFQITSDDLEYDSPYNTYRYPGLPPGPINNPGLDSITAAITPALSDYLYYLTGSDGKMHYATTHAGHLINRAKYLGK